MAPPTTSPHAEISVNLAQNDEGGADSFDPDDHDRICNAPPAFVTATNENNHPHPVQLLPTIHEFSEVELSPKMYTQHFGEEIRANSGWTVVQEVPSTDTKEYSRADEQMLNHVSIEMPPDGAEDVFDYIK